MFTTGWMRESNPFYKTATSLAGDGLYVALGNERGLVIARLRDGTYQIGTMLRLAADSRIEQAALTDDLDAFRSDLSKQYVDWAEPLRRIVENVEGALHPWPQYSLPPEGLQWTHAPGLTLIGDAAHLR